MKAESPGECLLQMPGRRGSRQGRVAAEEERAGGPRLLFVVCLSSLVCHLSSVLLSSYSIS